MILVDSSHRKTMGTLIATRCIEDGLTLLHSDRDFAAFAQHLGLRGVLGNLIRFCHLATIQTAVCLTTSRSIPLNPW